MNCYASIHNDKHDETIVPLLRRMSHLEKLNFYLCITNRSRFIDGSHLRNEFLVYLPQVHSFNFYISTYAEFVDSTSYVSRQDIKQININQKHQHMATIINYIINFQTICSIFDRLHDIGNIFPDTIFNNVTHLTVHYVVSFNHKFFIRVTRSFPRLTHLHLINCPQQSSSSNDSQTYSIIEYPSIISVDRRFAHTTYIELFLSERKAHVYTMAK